ncbi:mitochondrial import inner membrane translocase subunit Tim21 [Schistocerca gregaria]|uniref:mitochondrial import inner membrane translocase subunit Tim21 n=1 Tax=Schistocerca gregaria TaxID=7010 RepID=UPI00211ED95A|nr:mitochondrial import inner membrane translocase subunit Tim21 [Schistocerca gregaria]XP_049857146.1 mitochondrial import inner membrane translocase subunit Tim21 [Schistocerca gregaria]XP_049857147.1 mitochondrial import inner membrane translocase subunit Tim21 [Schistocerca gregaria]XP_049857148.1 mitochondrial import inner membrane translocase subunit Tim21 [Schistocerca gregaria]XP_049857150.1 mitochondrial import inner membrane translocase subunit Tim21 [Schistocerca gregaria]
MTSFAKTILRYYTLHSGRLAITFCGCQAQDRAVTKIVKQSSLINRRFYSNEEKKKSSLTVKRKDEVGAPKTLENVKEATKTVSYMGIILAGLGLTGVMFYTVFKELFSSKSPNSVYSKTLERCIEDPRIINALGEPIKGFGEQTRRGRRRHVSHLFYERDGINHLRMKFYIQGSMRRGTVHLEMRENDKKEFEYRYLFVQMDDFPRETIILEDNRYDVPSPVEKPFDNLLV